MKRILLALLCCYAVAAVGCGGSSPTSSSSPDDNPAPVDPPPVDPPPAPPFPLGPIEFETVYEGCRFESYGHSVGAIIENQADLETKWAEYGIPDPAPAVDFSERTVIASHGPAESCGCGSLEVTSVVQRESYTEVSLEWNGVCIICWGWGPWYWTINIISIPKTGTSIRVDIDCGCYSDC